MMHMMQHKHELRHAQSEQLACKRLLEKAEARKQLTALEKRALKEECAS